MEGYANHRNESYVYFYSTTLRHMSTFFKLDLDKI